MVECVAKIIGEPRTKNNELSKFRYDFLNLQTGEKDCFYSYQKLNYFPSLPGRLELSTDNFFQSFNQDVFKTEEEFKQFEVLENLNQLGAELEKDTSKIKSRLAKRRAEIIRARQLGITQKNLAIIYGVSERTIRSIEKTPSQPRKKRGRKQKITSYNLSLLCNEFVNSKERKIINQQEMADYYQKERNLEVHRSTISRTLKREKQTYKKATCRYWEQIPKLGEIVDFVKKRKHLLANPWFMTLDECKVNPTDTANYAYSKRGCPTIVLRQGKGRTNYTILLCIRNTAKNGVVHCKVVKGSANSEIFHQFLSNIKFPELPNGEKVPLLMDNVKFHWCSGGYRKLGLPTVQEYLESKNVEIIYAVKYVPEINPTEKCNNTAKNFVRNYLSKCRIRNEKELMEAVDGAVKLLNEQDMTKYFKSAFEYKIS